MVHFHARPSLGNHEAVKAALVAANVNKQAIGLIECVYLLMTNGEGQGWGPLDASCLA